jgi:hypothetical protein
MKAKMSHDEAFAELDAVAFDLLDGPERDAVMEHIESCDVCRRELDARRAVVADLAFAAPLATDSESGSRARIRSRLLSRTSAGVAPAPRTPTPFSGSPSLPPLLFPTKPDLVAVPGKTRTVPLWKRTSWIAAAAAGLLFAASLGVFVAARKTAEKDIARLQDALSLQTIQALNAIHASDSLASVIAARDSIIGGLTGRDVSMLTLTSSAAKDPYAKMFWDRAHNSWTLIAHNMPALKQGRTYQVWLVTPKSKISAGTFAPKNGEAVVLARYALTESLAAVAITDEPTGGSPQPTTTPMLVAATK